MANFKNYGQDGVASNTQFGKNGARVKNNSGVIELRNSGDSGYAIVRGASPIGANDLVTKQYFETFGTPVIYGNIYDSGSSTPASAQFTSSAQEGLLAICNQTVGTFTTKKLYRLTTWDTDVTTSTWVEINPTENMNITTSVASTGGTITFQADHIYSWDLQTSTWVDMGPAATVTSVTKNFRTNLAFGSSSPLAIGTLPDNAIVTKVTVIVATPFNGTNPTLDIGISGTVGKYMDNTQIDLKIAGTYIMQGYNLEASSIAVIGTYASDSSTAGSASILVNYDIV